MRQLPITIFRLRLDSAECGFLCFNLFFKTNGSPAVSTHQTAVARACAIIRSQAGAKPKAKTNKRKGKTA
jgi:hypothetical protein